MRWLVLAVFAAVALGGCKDDESGQALPPVVERPPSGSGWPYLKPVRRSSSSEVDLTKAEERQARRIVARDDILHPLLKEGRGYAVGPVGPVTAEDERLLVGAIIDLRLNRRVSGRFAVPRVCSDVKGRFIALDPIETVLTNVSSLMVTARFDERAIAEVSVLNGREGGPPGAREPPVPRPCADANRLDRGD